MCEEVADQKLQFQSAAMGLAQTIAEYFVIAMLSECAIYAAHAKRKTVLVDDLNLATRRDADYQLIAAQAQAEVMKCVQLVRKKQRL